MVGPADVELIGNRKALDESKGAQAPLTDKGVFSSAPHLFESAALSFAMSSHRWQTRKYTGMPYIHHPMAVADIVRSVTDNPYVIAAAYLHDVVEDTGVSFSVIADAFGPRVSDLVYWLTDISKPSDGNRKARKALDRAHIAKAPADAQTIKLADIIDNTSSIVEHDPDFAKVYLREKAELLEVLTKGHPVLLERARAIVCPAPPAQGAR